MAVGRVKHISPCLVGLPVGLTSKHRIAARLIRQLTMHALCRCRPVKSRRWALPCTSLRR